jgi:transcriptional regulator with GAF, ATPase, and Fis domain
VSDIIRGERKPAPVELSAVSLESVERRRRMQEGAMAVHAAPAGNECLRQRLGAETAFLHAELVEAPDLGEIVGRSPALRRAMAKVRQVADTTTPVLLLGETGAGNGREEP